MSFIRQGAATLLVFGLASCSMMPGSGPSKDAFIESGAMTTENLDPSFVVVDVNEPALTILARRGHPGLRGNFGDYRPPAGSVIGVGDSLQITLWEAAAGGLFSAPVQDRTSPGSHSAAIPDQIVGRDGSVTVPYAGRVQAAGRTPPQVEAAIVERLRGKAIEPQAVVNVSRNVSNTVTVTGEVTNGARVPLTLRGDRVMDVIAAAGGFRTPVHETFISLTRGNHTARAPIHTILANPSENIYVRPGDVLTVERTPQTFTVAGATGANGVVPFDARGLSLEEAIGKAGGLQDNRADPSGVFVLRYEPENLVREFPQAAAAPLQPRWTPIAYRLDLRDPSALFLARKFAMRDKDIVYVTNSPMTEVGKAFQLLNLLTGPAFQGVAVAAIVK